jgi:mannosyltransferase OCH1-like enzyme
MHDSGAAVLDPAVLQVLQRRQQHAHPVEDWYQLGNSSREVLQYTSFNIPKVIHQIWVGSAPQPSKWIDTWR